MKVKELIEQLQKVNQELEVVIAINDKDELRAFDGIWIDLGWGPSGVLSIESNNCIME